MFYSNLFYFTTNLTIPHTAIFNLKFTHRQILFPDNYTTLFWLIPVLFYVSVYVIFPFFYTYIKFYYT